MLTPPLNPGIPLLFIYSFNKDYCMFLKNTGFEARLPRFKIVALSLLDVLPWENHLTIHCLNFFISYTGLIIFPTSKAIVKTQ